LSSFILVPSQLDDHRSAIARRSNKQAPRGQQLPVPENIQEGHFGIMLEAPCGASPLKAPCGAPH
jgi:hypothetical protein